MIQTTNVRSVTSNCTLRRCHVVFAQIRFQTHDTIFQSLLVRLVALQRARHFQQVQFRLDQLLLGDGLGVLLSEHVSLLGLRSKNTTRRSVTHDSNVCKKILGLAHFDNERVDTCICCGYSVDRFRQKGAVIL
jgi:hypothetical protein